MFSDALQLTQLAVEMLTCCQRHAFGTSTHDYLVYVALAGLTQFLLDGLYLGTQIVLALHVVERCLCLLMHLSLNTGIGQATVDDLGQLYRTLTIVSFLEQ